MGWGGWGWGKGDGRRGIGRARQYGEDHRRLAKDNLNLKIGKTFLPKSGYEGMGVLFRRVFTFYNLFSLMLFLFREWSR